MIKIITLNSNAKTWQEMFEEVADYLLRQGIVKEGYKEFLKNREKEFPTGLKFNEDFAIALPHADIKYSNEQCVVLVKPSNNVFFNLMDDKNASVKVSLVVFLIITDPTIYNKFLSRLVTIFQDTKIQRFINNGDLEPLKEAIEKIE